MNQNQDIREPQAQTVKQEEVVDKIREAFDELNYNFIITTLQNVNILAQPTSGNIKKQCLTLFCHHLQTVYGVGSETVNSSYDLDTVLEIYAFLMTTDLQPEKSPSILKVLLEHSIAEDARYSFVIYRSKYTLIGSENDYNSLVRRLKFIRYISLFIESMFGRCGAMLNDFIQFVGQIRKTYQATINSGDVINREEDEHSELNSAYITYCNKILTDCSNFLQKSPTNTIKIYEILTSAISLALLTYTSNNQTIRQNLGYLNQSIQKILSSTPRTFSIASISSYPTLFLITIIKNHNYICALSSSNLLYLLYRLLCDLGPESTIGSKVGSIADKLDTILQDTIVKLCTIIGQINQGRLTQLKIQGQMIWVGADKCVNLLEIYRRIAIYSGFICAEYSKQCWELIKDLLKLEHNRYKECPILSLKIWENILTKSDLKEISFRIFCITEYRKILISHKNKIRDHVFETHSYHSHASILVDSGKLTQKQLQNILSFPDQSIDFNYVGHTISFISNWLTCCKTYTNANTNYHCALIKDRMNEVKSLGVKVSQKIKKSIEADKDRAEKKMMQVQLILFRLKGLDDEF